MAGWHHGLGGRESEWTPGDGDGQGGLVCCDSWGPKESDMTERLNWTHAYILRSLYHKCSILLKTFSASIGIIIWNLYFSLVVWCSTLIDFRIIKNPCFPEINPIWLWCIMLLTYCWIWIPNILWRVSVSMFPSDIGLQFAFWLFICIVLIIGWCWLHTMCLDVILSLQYFGIVTK